jgi:hypothetical protein
MTAAPEAGGGLLLGSHMSTAGGEALVVGRGGGGGVLGDADFREGQHAVGVSAAAPRRLRASHIPPDSNASLLLSSAEALRRRGWKEDTRVPLQSCLLQFVAYTSFCQVSTGIPLSLNNLKVWS